MPHPPAKINRFAAAAVMVALAAGPAIAQTPPRCLPHGDMLTMLATRWGEVPLVRGEVDGRSDMELTVSPSGSWTVVMTDRESGLACLLAAGDRFAPVIAGPAMRPPGRSM